MQGDILYNYAKFVKEVTSAPSQNFDSFVDRLEEIDNSVNIASLLTGSIGLSSETGELAEIVKKVIFQGKPMNDETIYHLKRELGDVLWYWFTTIRALGLDPIEVIQENVKKLENRYPGGKFNIYHSENREVGDL